MGPERRGWMAAGGNAAVLAPVLLATGGMHTVRGPVLLALACWFAWVEAANASGRDVSSGAASVAPLVTGLSLLATFVVGAATVAPSVAVGGITVGVAGMVLGVGLRRASMRALGDAFVSEPRPLTVRDRVRHGPYAWCTHPSEVGLVLLSGGAVLVAGSLPAAVVWALAVLPSVVVRVAAENRELARCR